MQINYQTVTIESLPGSDQLTADDYFIVAQDHHKPADTFMNGDFVGKKITLSSMMDFIRGNVPYIYNVAYKYNPNTLSTEVFDNIVGFKIVNNYITAAKDSVTKLLEIGLQLPQDISQTSNVTFNNITASSISTSSLTATSLNIASTITGVITSALKFQTAMAITLAGGASGSCSFDGTAGVILNVSINDNSHNHNDSTLNDISWTKVINKPSPRINLSMVGPVTGSAYCDLVSLNNGSASITTYITPGAIDLVNHTTGNYLNFISASGLGLSISGTASHNATPQIVLNSQSTNTPNSIVYRDAIGSFAANIITANAFNGNFTGNINGNVTGNLTGNVTGNSDTATRLLNSFSIAASGDISYTSPGFNGTQTVTGLATLSATGVVAGTYNNDGLSVRPFTVDAKGRLTSIGAAVPIIYNWSSITGLPTTSSGYGISDVYTKSYIDTLALGLKPKVEVKAATITSITLSGAQTIDGVSIVAGDRVLVMSQSASAANGIYVASASTWTRATDSNTEALLNGALVSVSSGTINANKKFYQTNIITTLNTDPVIFGVFASSGAYSPIITGAASTIVSSNLTASRVLYSDVSGKVAVSTTTSTELGYLTGVTSSIQTQFSNKADTSALTTHTSATSAHGLTSAIAGINDIQTLTNKTLNLTSNTLIGTKAQFNAALSDDDFATISGVETLQNKTLSSPIIYSPSTTGGTFLSGTFNNCTFNTPTFNSPTFNTPNIGVATGISFNSITGLGSALPTMNSVAASGTSTLVSRQDHIHPSDTSRAPFNGPGYNQNFTIGKLDSNDSGGITVSKTEYDASFTVKETIENKNASFNSIIGSSLILSFWKAGSFYDNGYYSYRIINGSNDYKAIEILDSTGKILFGDVADNGTDSLVQFDGNIDIAGLKFSNYLNGCYVTNRILQNNVNELILFNSYLNGDLGQITVRAPRLRFQTFSNQSVTDITNLSGEIDRVIVDEDGNIFINQQPEEDTVTTDKVKINGSIKSSGLTQSIKKVEDDIYQVLDTDYTILASSPSTGGQLFILPQVDINNGRILNIKKINDVYISNYIPFLQSNQLTIKPYEQDGKIDNNNVITLSSKFESVTLQSDGTSWYIL